MTFENSKKLKDYLPIAKKVLLLFGKGFCAYYIEEFLNEKLKYKAVNSGIMKVLEDDELKEFFNKKPLSDREVRKVIREHTCNHDEQVRSDILLDFYDSIANELLEKLKDDFNLENHCENIVIKFCDENKDEYSAIDENESLSILKGFLISLINLIKKYIVENPEHLVETLTNLYTKQEEQGEKLDNVEKIISELKQQISVKPKVPNAEVFFKSMYNGPAFLDKEKGKEINLKDIYVLPDYKENNWWKTLDNLDERLQSFLNEEKNKFLMIFGAPGIGKSTFVSHLLYSGDFTLPDKFRVYKIRDLPCFKSFDSAEHLPNMILNDLYLSESDLSDTLLVLDGLDEVELGEGGQTLLIEALYNNWIEYSNIKNFKLLITCRTARISTDDFKTFKPDCITLEPFSTGKVKAFIEKYTGERNNKELPVNKKSIEAINSLWDDETIDKDFLVIESNYKTSISEVISIPLILYMVISLGIEIEKSSDLVSIYNQIFSIDNERSIYNHAKESDRDIALQKSERKKIHGFSKLVAVKMWEINPEEAVLNKEEYEEIAKKVDSKENIHKLFSGQYFVEGSENRELYFVHRSMYEYFVALSYFEKLRAVIDILPDIKEKYRSKSVRELFEISLNSDLKRRINNEILDYIIKLFENEKIVLEEVQVQAFFEAMFEKGLPKAIAHQDRLEAFNKEAEVFFRLLFIFKKILEVKYPDRTFSILSEDCIKYYTMYAQRMNRFDFEKINMECMDLSFTDFKVFDLKKSCLCKAILRESDLHNADLSNADLNKINLRETDLRNADLYNTDLNNADLSNADLSNAYLISAKLNFADLSEAILCKTNLRYADLHKAILKFTDLREAILCKTNLSYADLHNAKLHDADLSGADLHNADLSEADLHNVDLNNVNLSKAKLSNVNLSKAYLHSADLSNADLSNADLCGADLSESDLRNAILDGAKFLGTDIYRCRATVEQKEYMFKKGATIKTY